LARKILLADDSVTAQNMGRKILTDAGYEVITVNNGSAALKKIAETKPDLIVLDVYMPGYSGLEVCSRLKEVKETARIPVLLTVGKLEPFKPEEAKRVKAEGYIVKPFEASELLSALSKLEDRVVPRSESSKPGRFARAIAAVEEGRTDETKEANDSDDGWKNRIVFPSKKKKKQEEDDSEIYNPGNRDLRTTVERPTAQRESSRNENSRNDDRLDVAALAATAGLPKDVTAEELAALAAAAAQVQAAVDGRESSPAFGPETGPATSGEASVAASAQASSEAASKADEAKVEASLETKTEPPVSQASQPEVAAEIAAGATFAGQTGEETPAAVSGGARPNEAKPSAPVRDFDVIAAPAAQAEGSAVIQSEAGSGNGSGRSQQDTERKGTGEKRAADDESTVPVTMAVAAAAGAGFVAAGSTTHRWTAVPVAIATEEAAVSLELEMQKAYAAFAAAEANQPGFVASPPERATPTVENSISAPAAEAPSGPVPDEDEIARTLRDVAHASAEAVDSALAKLEAVAEANAGTVPGVTQAEESSINPGETHTEIVAAAMRDLGAKRELEAKESEARELEAREREAKEREARELEAREREAKESEARELEAREHEAKEREARELEAREREAKESEARELEAREREAKEREAQELEAREREARELEAREREAREQAEAAATQAAAEAARAAESAASEQSVPQSPVSSLVSEPPVAAVAEEVANLNASPAASTVEPPPTETVAAVSEAPGLGKEKEKVAGGDMAENEIAATTAAAWASWRQIRESGDGKKATGPAKANQQDDDDDDYPAPPPDTAAMAVAAGAEKAAAEAPEGSADDPAAIASIVDKVLADLRPKIAEEISKKLKKK
jgi:CheY-like chemotaxis protein